MITKRGLAYFLVQIFILTTMDPLVTISLLPHSNPSLTASVSFFSVYYPHKTAYRLLQYNFQSASRIKT